MKFPDNKQIIYNLVGLAVNSRVVVCKDHEWRGIDLGKWVVGNTAR